MRCLARLHLQDNPEKTAVSALVDYEQLIATPAFDDATSSQPSAMSTDIREQPSIVLKCMGLAMYQAMHNADLEELALNGADESLASAIPFVTVRLYNFQPVTPLKHLKANYIGKFISIKGTVVRVGNIKPLVVKMAFRCARCDEEQVRAGRLLLRVTCIHIMQRAQRTRGGLAAAAATSTGRRMLP